MKVYSSLLSCSKRGNAFETIGKVVKNNSRNFHEIELVISDSRYDEETNKNTKHPYFIK